HVATDQALIVLKESNFSKLEFDLLLLKARIFSSVSEHDESIQYCVKALRVADRMGDKVKQAVTYNQFGINYDYQEMWAEANVNYNKALKLYTEADNQTGISFSLNNLGVIFDLQGIYDSAIFYYEQSMVIDLQLKDSVSVAGSYLNIGLIKIREGKFNEAEELFLNAEKIYLSHKDNENLEACYNNLSELYRDMNQLDRMIFYNEKSRVVAEKLGNLNHVLDTYEVLILAYNQVGDHEEAFNYARAKEILKDSIRNNNVTKEIRELIQKYKTEKNLQEIDHQRLINTEQQESLFWKDVTVYGVSIAIVVLLIMGIFLLLTSKKTRLVNTQLIESKRELFLRQKHIEQQNNDIKASIRYASDTQNSILPTDQILRNMIGDYFLLYMPKDIVSGDFYWAKEVNGKKLIAIADCTGHGVPGAFVSIMCSNVMDHIVGQGITDPGELLSRANIEIKKGLKAESSSTKDGMDVVIICQEKESVTFAGAMNSLYCYSGNELHEYIADMYSIAGSTPDSFEFKTQKVKVNKGDTIYMSTDGFQDQFGGEKGKKFMRRRMKELFIKGAGLSTLEKEKLFLDAFHSWRKDYNQVDDICILGIEI
ncbi:MAG: serine phosphatase RsbU (regulator of sigma subunit)/Tfp pilus assembly protein PilF, partial [Parvicellaceae bacterium]